MRRTAECIEGIRLRTLSARTTIRRLISHNLCGIINPGFLGSVQSELFTPDRLRRTPLRYISWQVCPAPVERSSTAHLGQHADADALDAEAPFGEELDGLGVQFALFGLDALSE